MREVVRREDLLLCSRFERTSIEAGVIDAYGAIAFTRTSVCARTTDITTLAGTTSSRCLVADQTVEAWRSNVSRATTRFRARRACIDATLHRRRIAEHVGDVIRRATWHRRRTTTSQRSLYACCLQFSRLFVLLRERDLKLTNRFR